MGAVTVYGRVSESTLCLSIMAQAVGIVNKRVRVSHVAQTLWREYMLSRVIPSSTARSTCVGLDAGSWVSGTRRVAEHNVVRVCVLIPLNAF